MSVWYFEYELLENYFSKNTIYIIHYMTVYVYVFYMGEYEFGQYYNLGRYGKLLRSMKLIPIGRKSQNMSFSSKSRSNC